MRDSVSFLHRVSAWTEKVGMTDAESTLMKIAITITVAILIYIISRKWLSKLLKKVVGKTKSTWDDILYDQGFFRKLASLIPPFTAYIVLTFITWEICPSAPGRYLVDCRHLVYHHFFAECDQQDL